MIVFAGAAHAIIAFACKSCRAMFNTWCGRSPRISFHIVHNPNFYCYILYLLLPPAERLLPTLLSLVSCLPQLPLLLPILQSRPASAATEKSRLDQNVCSEDILTTSYKNKIKITQPCQTCSKTCDETWTSYYVILGLRPQHLRMANGKSKNVDSAASIPHPTCNTIT